MRHALLLQRYVGDRRSPGARQTPLQFCVLPLLLHTPSCSLGRSASPRPILVAAALCAGLSPCLPGTRTRLLNSRCLLSPPTTSGNAVCGTLLLRTMRTAARSRAGLQSTSEGSPTLMRTKTCTHMSSCCRGRRPPGTRCALPELLTTRFFHIPDNCGLVCPQAAQAPSIAQSGPSVGSSSQRRHRMSNSWDDLEKIKAFLHSERSQQHGGSTHPSVVGMDVS